jgi:hypothetical protein
MMMTALAGALTVSGQTETLVARNHQTAAQARAAAEAGLNHASTVALAWILQWKANGYADVPAAITALLATPALLQPDVEFGTPIPIDGTTDIEYEVLIMDEDDAVLRGDDANDVNGVEDGIATNDTNKTLVIRSTGRASNSSSAVIEGIVSPYKLPAVVTNADFTITGNATIGVGPTANGGIHANGDLTLSGVSLVVTGVLNPTTPLVPIDLTKGTATASGTYSATVSVPTGDAGGGRAEVDIPSIEAADFRDWADRILTVNGTSSALTLADGTSLCTAGFGGIGCLAYGWRFTSGEWNLASSLATGHTVYVEGPVTVAAGAGSALIPVEITLMAEGGITAAGGYVSPEAGDLLFVTDKDLKISGNVTVVLPEGQMLVHGQVEISGVATIVGQLIIENATSTETPHSNSISGTASIINYSDIGSSMFHISGWREDR